MKKIINGKKYDTETANRVASDSYGEGVRDFHHWTEELYQKRTGEFFLHGEGGPLSKYANATSYNGRSGGEEIIPLSVEEARQWMEEHADADDYEELFGKTSEDGAIATTCITMPVELYDRIKRYAVESNVSMSRFIEITLQKALDE